MYNSVSLRVNINTCTVCNVLYCTSSRGSISETEIRCVSTAYTGNISSLPSNGSVVVHIDNANITGTGVEFTFRNDPTFTSVTPRMTIPA